MTPCILESPFAGNVDRHLRYVRAAMRTLLLRGYAPFPSHALYTQPGVLDDSLPEERELGIVAGFSIGEALALLAAPRVFAVDEGWSGGMKRGRDQARELRQDIEIIRVPGWTP